MNTEPMPDELVHMILESDELQGRINALRAKPRLTLADLREIVNLKVEIQKRCPPNRYVWLNGRPVIDVLKSLNKIECLRIGDKTTYQPRRETKTHEQ